LAAIKVPDSGASASIAKTVNNIAKVNDALKLDTISGIKEFLNNENLANTYLYEKGIQDALKEFVKLGFPDYVKPNSAFVKVFDQLSHAPHAPAPNVPARDIFGVWAKASSSVAY